ncbi:MAG: hypothetical protein AAF959_04300 [Cyanobacteria bacterium P01_D01_bin.56]
MMPSTVKDSAPQSGRISKRRWMFLTTTALVGSGMGLALGSTARFHMVSVGQASPLFKPQQDFPPLAEWPPEVSFDPSYGDLDKRWAAEPDVPQLVYKGPPSLLEAEDNQEPVDVDASTDLETEEVGLEESTIQVDPMGVNVGNASDAAVPEGIDVLFPDDRLSSDVLADTEKLPDELADEDTLESQQTPLTDTYQWFQKQPASSAQPTEDNASVDSRREVTSVSEEFID